jgi:beta-galactosidase
MEMLIKAHRNNPAVIMWSLGNEEPLHAHDIGKRIFETMREHARRLDNTRPFMTAVSNNPGGAPVMDECDIVGINYNLTHYDGLHEKYPTKMIFASECCAVGSTRGWFYDDNPKRGYLHCYDNRTGWFMSREVTWKFLSEREWIGGGYQWAGIEHRGETVWPRLCSQSGAVDLFLNRKDAFFQNQSHWTDKPMAHLLPHWNWQGREGEEIRVSCYTNCDEVKLLLNGFEVGSVQVEPYGHAEWQVPYAPGRLEAIGYRNGTEVCRDVRETTGRPVALRLKLESEGVQADGSDVAIITCDCVDSEGRHVPDAGPMVSFMTNELGTVVGTGSDISDHVPVTSPDRRMRAGLISVLVRAGKTHGILRVYAKTDGMPIAKLDIEI